MIDVDSLNRWFRPWSRRIMTMVRRLTVSGSNDALGLQRLQIETLAGVTQDGVERVQNYGFTSRPKKGAEGVVLYLGGNSDHGVVIAVDDMRYRVKVEEGEVAIYTDEGDKIHFKRGNKIDITTGTLTINASAKVNVNGATEVNVNTVKATVTASGDATITAANATITAQTKADIMAPAVSITAGIGVTMTTPLLSVTGLVACAGIGAGAAPVAGKAKVSGDIESTGQIKDSVGTMSAIRTAYNGHTHPGVQSGPSSTGNPTPTM